jgi:lactam utilization protein B
VRQALQVTALDALLNSGGDSLQDIQSHAALLKGGYSARSAEEERIQQVDGQAPALALV